MSSKISFQETEDAYLFSSAEDEPKVFAIKKDDLIFDAGKFYECFFKDLEEKPEYQLVSESETLAGQAKHIFTTVETILNETCNGISGNWFKDVMSQDGASGALGAEKDDSQLQPA